MSAMELISEKRVVATASDAIVVKGVSKFYRIPLEKKYTVYDNLIGLLKGNAGSYQEFWALKDVSFSVKKGETFGVIGPNGSGKSTLLKIIASVLYPDEGTVYVNGRIAPFLELGVGFQPDLSAEDNVYLYGSVMGLTRGQIKKQIDEIFHFAELEKFRNTKLKNFSSGMYARLAFSTAISTDPDIILIDEALSVGDEAFQHKCFDKIREFKRSGKTIVFVSHGMGTVQQICDRAILLDHGIVQSSGYSEMVIDSYHSAMRIREEMKLKEQNEKSVESKPIETSATLEEPVVKADRQDPTIKDRWGSKEIEIIDVKFIDMEGKERYTFKTNEPFTARIKYFAAQEISRPVFGAAITRNDGVLVNGTNAKLCGKVPDSLRGEGWVDYRIGSLPLLTGTYLFTAVIYDYECKLPYDHHEKRFSFMVTSDEIKEPGFVYIPSDWIYSK